MERIKSLLDVEVKYALTNDHITLANADALKTFLLGQDYTREAGDGGFYRLLLNEENSETFMQELKDQCELLELELVEFVPEENGEATPAKKARTA